MKAAFLAANELRETLLREEVPRRRAAAIVMFLCILRGGEIQRRLVKELSRSGKAVQRCLGEIR